NLPLPAAGFAVAWMRLRALGTPANEAHPSRLDAKRIRACQRESLRYSRGSIVAISISALILFVLHMVTNPVTSRRSAKTTDCCAGSRMTDHTAHQGARTCTGRTA